jgi:glycosyltransferase involved in cell wall biosynthesis
MKLLHVTTYVHPDRVGGAERIVDGLTRAQVRGGHEVTLVTGGEPHLPPHETRAGVRIIRYPLDGKRGWRFYRDVYLGVFAGLRQVAGERFDVLHAHQPASGGPALEARLAMPRIYSFHASQRLEFEAERLAGAPASQAARLRPTDRVRSILIDHFQRRQIERADRVIVHSPYARAQLDDLAPRVSAKVRMIPPGIDTDRFRPDEGAAARVRARFGVPPDAALLLTARRLVRRVGIDLLLDALGILRQSEPRFRALITGDGPERAALEAQCDALGLRDVVLFHGRVSDAELVERYQAADFFVLPTRSLEGFGLATLEALACATPVVATDVGATPGLLADLGGGVLSRAEPADLARALGEAIAQRASLREAAHTACERVAASWSWDARAREVEQLYLEAGSKPL